MFIEVIEVGEIVSVTVEVECDSFVEKTKRRCDEGNLKRRMGQH